MERRNHKTEVMKPGGEMAEPTLPINNGGGRSGSGLFYLNLFAEKKQ